MSNTICPLCKSTNVEDASTYASNGVLGPGHSSWKTFDALCCNNCGIFFRAVEPKEIKPNIEKENLSSIFDNTFYSTLPF